jgi:hypothetical protein
VVDAGLFFKFFPQFEQKKSNGEILFLQWGQVVWGSIYNNGTPFDVIFNPAFFRGA